MYHSLHLALYPIINPPYKPISPLSSAALGGDTWVVGCPIPDCAVYPKLNALNPDFSHPTFSASSTGMYTPGVGMMNLSFAFGHDEYAFLMALHNKIKIPEEGLAILRLHSCYPWHTGKAYRDLMKAGDEKLEASVIEFNQCVSFFPFFVCS